MSSSGACRVGREVEDRRVEEGMSQPVWRSASECEHQSGEQLVLPPRASPTLPAGTAHPSTLPRGSGGCATPAGQLDRPRCCAAAAGRWLPALDCLPVDGWVGGWVIRLGKGLGGSKLNATGQRHRLAVLPSCSAELELRMARQAPTQQCRPLAATITLLPPPFHHPKLNLPAQAPSFFMRFVYVSNTSSSSLY